MAPQTAASEALEDSGLRALVERKSRKWFSLLIDLGFLQVRAVDKFICSKLCLPHLSGMVERGMNPVLGLKQIKVGFEYLLLESRR
jgi:hypothetical protein